MSETPAEIAVGTQEAAAPTTPKFSAASTPAPASQPGFDKAAFMSEILAEVDKRNQSIKDKRLAAIDRLGGVEDLVKLKEYIKAKPTDPDGAIRDYQLDQLLAERSQQQPAALPEVPVRTAPADTTLDVTAWTTDILTEAGVDWNTDAAYQAHAAKPYASPEAWKTATVKFIAQRAKQGYQPGAASAAATTGGATLPGNKGTKQERKDAIYARLDETQKEPTKFAAERAKLKAELKTLA